MLFVKYDSRSLHYKNPFGAVPVKTKVTFTVDVMGDEPAAVSLHIWLGEKESIFALQKQPESTCLSYRTIVPMPEQPGNLWYYFVFNIGDKVFYYGNNERKLGGEGKLYTYPPPSFQLTVYQKSQLSSDLAGGLIYQIFPDRFFNPHTQPLALKKDSLLHDDWYRQPLYARDTKTQGILAYDFYGGNLDGIIAKLDYLADFGVTVLYLNPIFLSPSNHRYDVSDYEQVDPMLGDEKTFKKLCQAAEKKGISIILDGVFSHTGSDSRYFNKEGNFSEIGAYQSSDSKYYKWYKFLDYPAQYESWWGIETLPNVEELEPSYLEYMLNAEDGVAVRWLKAGAKGWRLDVADELPEEFIQALRESMKAWRKDSFLLGEVWEDASNKVTYGKMRNYFLGDQLDSVMNYPFRQAVLDFLQFRKGAGQVLTELFSLYENYPRENFNLLMNLLGSHDTTRILTELAQVDANAFTDQEKRNFTLHSQLKAKAVQNLRLALVWQLTFCGLPAIYYGDEAGMQGFADPYNRGPYPWQREDEQVFALYWHLVRMRQRYEVLRLGSWQPLPTNEEIVAYERSYLNEKSVIALNRSEKKQEIIFAEHNPVADLLSGEVFIPQEGKIKANLMGKQARVFHQKVRYPDRLRKAGLLLHLSCLPSKYGIGDLGPECYKFLDFLAETGHQLWQILPLNPVDNFGSPYAGNSAFAGNVLLLSPEILKEKGYLSQADLESATASPEEDNYVNFPKVRERKEALFRAAYKKFLVSKEFQEFCQQESFWLEDYALFCALQNHFPNLCWYDWPAGLLKREREVLELYKNELRAEITYQKFLQYEFWSQWQIVKEKAQQKDILIIGDIPIYLAENSADVWANQDLFELGPDKRPVCVAGVPPDYFSSTGQLWGNPLYNWTVLKETGYKWWKERIRQTRKLVNLVRLDHFRGFESYCAIAYGSETAEAGEWRQGPGEDFFLALKKEFGELDFIAEDLGLITSEVIKLRDRFCLPGMDILQFGLSGDVKKILYTGTHDNNTLIGWLEKNKGCEAYVKLLELIKAEESWSEQELAAKVIEYIYACAYIWVILPLQDLLGLDSKARMNTPSTIKGNWRWRFAKVDLEDNLRQKTKKLVENSKRKKEKNIDEILPGM